MGSPISRILFDWMHDLRIVAQVAEKMNKKPATLSAELRPNRAQAKLGADDLVPLFHAIRAAGFEDEMRGILRRYVHELTGDLPAQSEDEDFSLQLHNLYACLGSLSKAAAQIEDITSVTELEKLEVALRTEILSRVCKLEDIVDARLRRLRKAACLSDSEYGIGRVLPKT